MFMFEQTTPQSNCCSESFRRFMSALAPLSGTMEQKKREDWLGLSTNDHFCLAAN